MQKERLFLSTKKVRVEYEFVNDTDRDIATEVAFPIPEYAFEINDPDGHRAFDDFRLWVGNSELRYKTDIKAMVNGKDLMPLLQEFGIDANSFGRFDWDKQQSLDFLKLPVNAREQLQRAGAFQAYEGHFPAWTIAKTYHWTQVFPAHKIVHVKSCVQAGRWFHPYTSCRPRRSPSTAGDRQS